MATKHKPVELTPEKFTGLEHEAPPTVAAGLTAVVSSAKHLLSEMDPLRATKAMFALNQKQGIDCPGCAWPDPDDERSSIAEYCENGAKAIAEEATTKKLDEAFFAKYSVEDMGEWTDFEIGKKGRIAQPMIIRKGETHYQPISWQDAFQTIGNQLKSHGPNEGLFYTSGRTSNEAAFLYQLFVRLYGTNNLPDCSNMCHESSGLALTETTGIGKGSVTLDDIHHADVILVIGQNPATNHPRMLSALQKAKENGSYIVSINPLPEAGLISFRNPQKVANILGKASKLTDLFLQVRINGDMPLLKAVNKMLWEKGKSQAGVIDHEFIQSKTHGFESYQTQLESENLQQLIAQSGVPAEQLETLTNKLAGTSKIVACWAMGLTQHKNAVGTIQEVVNMLLLKGAIGKPGAGTCPVRGHSNVQGDRTMGIYEKPKPEFIDWLEKSIGVQMPREHGYDVVDGIKAMHEGKIGTFIAMGGNFLSAAPDTVYTAEALRNCGMTIHVSTKLNRSHLVYGDVGIILPCLGRTDEDKQKSGVQFVSVENSMGIVHMSKGKLKPISDKLLSEPAIVAGIANATLGGKGNIDWNSLVEDYDRIRELIQNTLPGFDEYNKRVRQPAGFYLPNGARKQEFKTMTGKANFTTHVYEPLEIKQGELLMMTIRSHDQFNTTIYGLDDRYRGIYNERRVVLLNKEDMNEMGIAENEVVDLYNHHGGVERYAPHFIALEYNIPKGCCATYFPETNVLVPVDTTADRSNTPTSKSIVITIKKR